MLATDGRSQEAASERRKQLAQTLQHMASETERAGAVVRQLMRSMHQPDITLAPVMLGELLHAVAHMFLDENAFDCQIDIDCAPEIRTVSANRLQLTKVLVNLISNSAQAMKNAQIDKGRIWIEATLASDGAAVVVSVRDTGPGISVKMQQEVFQPFVTTKSDGLGMGLTISRALIELHGGALWCENQAAAGALFRFTLPISKNKA
jgi:signal transduction histidine kinase